MKLFTSPTDYTTFVDEDNYQEISIDEIFDALENALNDLEDACDNLRDGVAYDTNTTGRVVRSLSYCESEIRRGEELWKQLVSDNEAKYFVLDVYEHIFDERQDINKIMRAIFKLKPVTFIWESVEIDPDALKYVAEKKVYPPEKCLFPAKLWADYKPEIRISRFADCEATAKERNETYRIYKCKDCGLLVDISRREDDYIVSKGMKPFQRCELCRKKHKYPNSPWRWGITTAQETSLFTAEEAKV